MYNTAPWVGQSNSVRLGVENSCRSSAGFMFFVGDQPFINESINNRMVENFTPASISAVVPIYNGKRGSPVIFDSFLREKLLCLCGDSGGRVLLKEFEGSIITVSFEDEKLGLDIDTLEEYEEVIR